MNEATFAARWAETVRDVDYALVADTGSSDDTVAILRANHVTVANLLVRPFRFDDTVAILQANHVTVANVLVRPFRFDDARNAALALLPDDLDVLIALDMDETLVPNWRTTLERHWQGTRLRYGYVWSWIGQKPDVKFLSEKITGRFTHRWKHPVHETLVPTVPERIYTCEDVLIEHHADPSKPRTQYLDLLKLAVSEDPQDDRSSHYLGREYFFHRAYQAAIYELTRHLSLSRATWAAERAASMRYIGKCHEAMADIRTAHSWFIRAVLEESSRETLIDAARFSLTQNAFHSTIDLCERALALGLTSSYMADRYANDEGPYDLAAVAYFHIRDRHKAITYAAEAVRRNPDDPRLRANLTMMGG